MPRFLILAALLSVVLFGTAGAQPADSFLYFTQGLSTAPATVYQVDANGKLLATLASFPGTVYPQGIDMAGDNRSYRVLLYAFLGSTYKGAIMGVSATGAVTTIYAGAPLVRPVSMVLDSDGDWLIIDQGLTLQGQLLRLSGTSLTPVANVGLTTYGMAMDLDSGQVVVRGQTRTAPLAYGYFRIDPVTGAVTGFSTSTTSIYTFYGSHEMPFESRTGAYVDLLYSLTTRSARMVRAHPEIGMSVFPNTASLSYASDLVGAHPAAAQAGGPAYHALARVSTSSASYAVFQIKADGSLAKASTIVGAAPYYRSSLTRVGSRHLAWSMVKKPNARVLSLDVPGSAGQPYVVGFSLSGVRPGPLLYDGREIPLVPDGLTELSLKGGVPGVLENTIGFLDASGRATIKVDGNAFGTGLKGRKAWAAALILDKKAPSGVRAVVGPTLLVFK